MTAAGLDAVRADEPPALPAEPPVTAWECSGHTRCRTLVYEPGGYCLACETDIRDAWEAAL